MSLDQHFNAGDEMEEEGQAGQVDASLVPALNAVEHSRKDSNSGRSVKGSRNLKPKQVHIDIYLTGVKGQYTVIQITLRPVS
jgi:hypothetical protein